MGSQALGSPAEAESSIGSSAPLRPARGARPRPRVIAALFAAAWIVPILTQKIVLLAGTHVHNLTYSPFTENWLITQMWVSG